MSSPCWVIALKKNLFSEYHNCTDNIIAKSYTNFLKNSCQCGLYLTAQPTIFICAYFIGLKIQYQEAKVLYIYIVFLVRHFKAKHEIFIFYVVQIQFWITWSIFSSLIVKTTRIYMINQSHNNSFTNWSPHWAGLVIDMLITHY